MLRGLLDHGIEVVDRFLALAKLEVSRRPSEPSVEIIRVRLEGGFRRLQGRGSTFLACWAAGRPRRDRGRSGSQTAERLRQGVPLPKDRLNEAVSEVPLAVLCQTPE